MKLNVVTGGMVVVGIAGAYFGWKYIPVQLHKSAIRETARTAAAKMMVEYDDRKLAEWIRQDIQDKTGIEIGYMSELSLERQSGSRKVVTVNWTEQIDHVWGSTHTIEMTVTESAEHGGAHLKMKNAQ